MESYKICDHFKLSIGSFVFKEKKSCKICNLHYSFFGDNNLNTLVINNGIKARIISCSEYGIGVVSCNEKFNNLQEAIDFNIKYLNNIIFE